ncbi:toprim domain-containing protein [Roseomonas sp. BN140053]|uniref:DUF7146 domain-containing protein n=1 Tax=Roseomonas sp. BN140053 TaxID=3391898 RepID=UPI0039E7D95B
MLADRIRDLTDALVGEEPSHRSDLVWRFRSRGSLQVWVSGEKRGKWKDHEAGEYGDALALVAHLRRTSMRDAYSWALNWLGIARLHQPVVSETVPTEAAPLIPTKAPVLRPERDSGALAWRVWSEAQDALDTPVQRYLAGRGLSIPPGAPIRFHPACPRGAERLPAMVALMTQAETGAPCGVHRTFLAADGTGKAPGQAKMMLGRAGVIRLVPDEQVELGLGIAEGIETSLAVMQGFDWRPVWAATSAGAIAAFPVLRGLDALTVFADADDGGVGLKAATACVRRWSAAGFDARIVAAPPEHDFADLLEQAG